MARIVAAVEQGRRGAAEQARAALEQVWDGLGPDGDPLHRCTLAHYLADLFDDPADALCWDERALAAAHELTDRRAQEYHASLQVRGFLPSLHLNLADDLRRLGRAEQAREQLALARRQLPDLPPGGYAATVAAGIEHVERALDAGDRNPLPTHP